MSFAFLFACLLTQPLAPWVDYVNERLPYLLVFVLVWLVIAVDQHLYVSRRNESLSAVLFGMGRAVISALLGSTFLSALLYGLDFDRGFVLTFGLVATVSALGFTLVLQPGVWNLRRFGYNLRHIVIVGANERTARLVEVLLAHEHYGYRVDGFLDDDESRRDALKQHGIAYLGPISNLDGILVNQVLDGVYITLPIKSSYEMIESIAHLCEGVGVPVRLVADLFPLRLSSSDVTSMDGMPMLALRPGELPQSAIYSRIMDSLTAAICILVLSPVYLLVSALILATSGRPLFTLQWRQEVRRPPFQRIRFRVYKDGTPESGFIPMGRFLHVYGVEKLPELFNILMGQMSFTLPQLIAAEPANSDAPRPDSRRHIPRTAFGVAGVDFVCLVVAYVLALAFTSPDISIVPHSFVRNILTLAVFLLFWAGSAYDERLWSLRSGENLGQYLTAVVRAVCNAAVFSVLITAIFMPDNIEQDFLLLFCATTLCGLLMVRVIGRNILLGLRRRGYFMQRVLLIGANERTLQLARQLKLAGQKIDGVIDDEPARASALLGEGLKYIGKTSDLDRVLAEKRVDRVFITLPLRSYYPTIQEIVSKVEHKTCTGYLLADLLPLHIARSQLTLVEDIPLLSLSPICEAYGKLAMKRLVDFLGSTFLITCFSPIFLAIFVLIKLDSRGPVFFAQERVGQNQRRFKILKFRSMIQNAEELRAQLESQNEADGPVFKIRNDPRITRVGKYLRRLSLDELPQLFNVWWGQMSLVGPRPPIPSEVELYSWHQRRRLSVKPGMTGLWQVSGRSDIPFEQWVQMDLTYIDTWSLSSDMMILLRTFKAVTSRRGAA